MRLKYKGRCKGGIKMYKLKGRMDKAVHYDVEMKGWMQKVGIIMCKLKGRFGLVWFVSFNDIWSQLGHSMSCMTIFFINKCKSADQTSGHT